MLGLRLDGLKYLSQQLRTLVGRTTLRKRVSLHTGYALHLGALLLILTSKCSFCHWKMCVAYLLDSY